MKVFGFKSFSSGKHTLIAGHVETKDGNVEFSTSFDHSDVNALLRSLNQLANDLTNISIIDRCSHTLSVIDPVRHIVSCRSCGFEGECVHQAIGATIGEWDMPGTIYLCYSCGFKFTYEGKGGTKVKIPYNGPVESNVRAGEGSSHS